MEGIVGKNELFEAFAQGKGRTATVHDFMRTDPVLVTPTDTGLTGGDLMNKHDLDWLPVVDDKDSRRLTGVIRSERMFHYLVSHLSEESGSN